MKKYYVNKNAGDNGYHEVHDENCHRLPYQENRLYLGQFSSCTGAVKEAEKTYPKSDGCYYCSPACNKH